MLIVVAGTNTAATPGEHALRQSAGEEDGQARANNQEAGATEVAHQQDLDQYVSPNNNGDVFVLLSGDRAEGQGSSWTLDLAADMCS